MSSRPPQLYVTDVARSRLLWLPDAARSGGVHIVAGRGSGKSLLLGRCFCFLDGFRGIPVVFFDNIGGGIDNYLFMVDSLPEPHRERMLDRTLYVDMSGHFGSVVPFPLYFRLAEESWYMVAQRYLAVIRKLDPELQAAPIAGWNAMYRIGTNVGMVLASLHLQITEAEDLIFNPERWRDILERLAEIYPELASAANFFYPDLFKATPANRGFRTETFLNKIAVFRLDPAKRAMFGATIPGITWTDIIQQRKIVLLDFRHEHDLEWQRLLTLWVYMGLAEYFKSRPNRAEPPVSFIVDELSYLVSMPSLNDQLSELVNVISRNHNIYLTLGHQELNQFDNKTKHTLLTLGTQIIGSTTDPQAAREVTRRFVRYNPRLVKKEEPMYMGGGRGLPYVIDYRTTEFSAEEQELRNSYKFLDLPRFTFLVAVASEEGTPGQDLRRMSIERLIGGRYADTEKIAVLRQELAKRSGTPIPKVLAEIEERRQRLLGNGLNQGGFIQRLS